MQTFAQAREPVNSLTHFIGAVSAAVGTVFLAIAAVQGAGGIMMTLGALIFGLSMVALYSASALYHYVRCSARALVRLRKLDHAMIYVLIAGTYTPLFLRFSEPGKGVTLAFTVWGLALLGIVLKLAWLDAPRWLSTLFYLAIGWAILLDPGIFSAIPAGCLTLVAAGGASYTIGAVIYCIKKPNFSEKLGFHEIFHVFVMLGTFLHFLAIYFYIV